MRDERDIRPRVLMETQHLVEVDVVDKAAVRQEDVTRGRMFNEVQIVIEILEIALTALGIVLCRRQVEETVVTTRQIPVFAGTQVIEHGTRFIGEHDAHLVDARIDHA